MSRLATRVERRASKRPRRAPTPFAVLVVAFILLLASAGTILVAQIRASHIAPWVSIGLSGAVLVVTVFALRMRPRP